MLDVCANNVSYILSQSVNSVQCNAANVQCVGCLQIHAMLLLALCAIVNNFLLVADHISLGYFLFGMCLKLHAVDV